MKQGEEHAPGPLEANPLDFASLIAHQIQSPLSAVSTALSAVLSDYTGPLQPAQRSSLEKAQTRCDQAMMTVRRMLAIIRAQEDQSVAAAPIPVHTVLQAIHTQYAAEAASHDIALDLETSAEDLYVAVEEEAFTEVLRALLNNALKYTPDRGQIKLSAARAAGADHAVVSVADSGTGISEAHREEVFKPFFRTPAARESARPGTGLGLAFVKSIVTAAGGTVTAGRAPLGGALFTITLPLTEAPAPGPDTAPAGHHAFRVVVIGGVTAGPKAAAKIIRLMPDAEVTIVERGNIMAYAGCGLPYYVSGVVRDQKRLIASPAGVARDPVFFRNVKNVRVMNGAEALRIDRPGKRVLVRSALTHEESWLAYDKLMIATGASPIVPGSLKSSLRNVFSLHGVKDAEGIRMALAENKAHDVVIVGGGLIGIEMTEALVRKGARVTIVEKLPHILPILDPELSCILEKHLEAQGVRILAGTEARGFEGKEKVSGVVTSRGTYPADVVILGIGVHPNAELAGQAGLDIGPTGAIRVDDGMRTSDPDIFAAGDCAEQMQILTGKPCYVPLGSTAAKQGRVAAINICGGHEAFPGVLGTCICKVFDFTVARTGLGETEARGLGFDPVTALVPGPDRAHYMPEARMLLLKLIVDRESRRLLGVQATGPGAADKRIDVAAVALGAGWTVDQLAHADLSYAPPYSPAMDNLITAANVVRNKLDGLLQEISAVELHDMMQRRADVVLLDVRTPAEFEQAHLPNSVLAPLGSLRGRLADLPRDQDLVTVCDIGLRGYEAALILMSAGLTRVRVLDGGLVMWPFEKVE